MNLRVIIRPEAEDDLRQAHEYLQESRPALATAFLIEFREALERIESVRAARLKKLRYVIYHIVFADRVEISAVLHGSRDPTIWRSRV